MICEYGCGQEGIYFLSTPKKWCCSESCNSCPELKRKNSEANKDKVITTETKEKLRKFQTGRKHHTKESKKKLSQASRLTLSQMFIKHPFFSKIEEMRYNPHKPNEKEIQVHCKNHNCLNSKEKDGWFTPTFSQIAERIRQLEHIEGNGGSYFYCSNKCKQVCPLYGLSSDPFKNIENRYTNEEYQTFRKFVLERDSYECQFCGEKATDVHHEKPQKLEPFFALDPDFAWSCCKECHYKHGHKDECSTGSLAHKICN